MSGISKQEGGIPMKISKKMLAAAVLALLSVWRAAAVEEAVPAIRLRKKKK